MVFFAISFFCLNSILEPLSSINVYIYEIYIFSDTYQQKVYYRPDIIARVFNLKIKSILKDFTDNQVLGRVAGYVYTIEFQKRGLPHMHLLLIMHPDDRPKTAEEVDDFISAELPIIDEAWLKMKPEDIESKLNDDEKKQLDLWHLVTKHMVHTPCGEHNREAACMRRKKDKLRCRFKFPFKLVYFFIINKHFLVTKNTQPSTKTIILFIVVVIMECKLFVNAIVANAKENMK